MKETLKKAASLAVAFFVGYAPVTWASYRFTDTSNVRVGGIDDSGNADFNGSVTANSFSGDGSNLTGVTATPGDDSVSTAKLQNSAVTTPKIASDAVTGDKVLNGTLGEGKLSFDPATQAELNSHESNASAHHTKTTDASELTSGTLDNARLSASVSLLGSSIGTSEIESAAVTTAKVAADAITTPAVLDGNITPAKVSFNYAGSSSKGGAATSATALAANGTNCSAGSAAGGVDASGNAEDCIDFQTQAEADALYQPLDADLTDLADGTLTFSKVGGATPSRAAQFGAGGALEASSVTTTELGYVSGVTSAIQTQINGKQAADADLDDLADGELTLTKVQYFQLVDTSANICSAVPTAAANIALSNDEYDLYIATGTAIGQWRNSRTGSGPC